jgi:hypothetical protein
VPAEGLTNNVQTTLSAAIGSTSATAISVASAAGFPSGQLLTANQSSFETGTTGWVSTGGNSAIAQSTAQALDGTHSLSVTASSAADMYAATSIGTSGVPVTGGGTYTAYAFFRAATTGRNVQCTINWYDSGGTIISGSNGVQVADTTTGWTQAYVTAVAPSNAAFAALITWVRAPANAEVHYVDVAWLAAGYLTQWRILVDSEIMVVTGGHGLTTWVVTRGAEGTTAATHLINATVIQLLTAGALANFGPQGVLAYAQITANQASVGTSPTDITGLLVSVTVPAGRRIRISAQTFFQAGAATYINTQIQEGATTLQQSQLPIDPAGGAINSSLPSSVVLIPSAGTHTYKLQGNCGTGTVTFLASATFPAYIMVEDIGAAS